MARRPKSGLSSEAWLCGVKLRPARQRVRLVDRPQLLDKLARGLERRLTLIQAPAGYGKTTALAQWREHLVARGVRCAWLTLDADDRDPHQFLAYLARALTDAGLELGQLAGMAPSGLRALRPPVALASLQRELERSSEPTCILLDDYHNLESREIDAMLDALLQRLPPHFHLAIATRGRPRLSYASLRTRGLLTELDAEDFRFSVGETRRLFGDLLSDEELSALLSRTEGWVVALQLARLWVEESEAPGSEIRSFTGSSADVAEYLAEQVLARLPPEIQSFLIETSHLARIHGDLADTVRGRNDSWDMLRRLAPLHALLVPIDGSAGWYRHHQLFAEFLRQQLTFLGAARTRALHLGASRWFADNGHLLSAVKHARQAGALRRAAALIEKAGGLRVGLQDGLAQLNLLLDNLPRELIYERPRLKLARAFLLSKEGRLADARRHLDEVMTETHPGNAALDSDILLMDVMLGIYEDTGSPDGHIAAMEALERDTPEGDHFVRGWLNNLLCIMQFRRGNLRQARAAADAAMAHYVDLEAVYLQVFIHLHLGLISLEEGRLNEAYACCRRAAQRAAAHFGSDAGLVGLTHLPLAEVRFERNEIGEARALVFAALADVEQYEGWVDVFARGYMTASALAYIEGGLDAALATLERAAETAADRELPRLRWLATCRRVEVLTLAGETERAAALAAEAGLRFGGRSGAAALPLTWRERWQSGIALARLAIRAGDHARAQRILGTMRRECEAGGNRRTLIKVHVLAALCLAAQDRVEAAAARLQCALQLAVPEGFRRAFIDEGEPMADLLRRLVRHIGIGALPGATVDFVADVLIATGANGAGPALAKATALLSPREREILCQLNEGQSNKMIARALAMAEPTVKFHLKNIYAKLGVNNRTLAVAVARRCELVS